MPEFLELLAPDKARRLWLDRLERLPAVETILTENALGRVTWEPVIASHPLPAFNRSTVDGYAVRAADTYGASESLPAYFHLVGEIPMGSAPKLTIQRGECALVHTGGMLPQGADAVVMLEHTQPARLQEIELLRAVASDENVLKIGEDVSAGEMVIPAGVRLRPAEIGGLMALGVTQLPVAARPRVGILSSGDEVIPPGQAPAPGQVRDVNAYTLSALVEAAGGIPVRYGILPDTAQALHAAAAQALAECELVVITAGSSASSRDLTAEVINQLGKPGVLVHGVNVRPGKPTILAICEGKGVVGLPGNPVSALVIAMLFVRPAVGALLGLAEVQPTASVAARLTTNLPSQAGREDWVPVRLVDGDSGRLAEPIFGKSNLIFTLARAAGLVRIPPAATGLSAGAPVEVILL